MNANQQQESVSPRVPILVETGGAGGGDGRSSATNNQHGIGGGLLDQGGDATGRGDADGMSPGSELAMENDESTTNSGPTAIPADEGDTGGGGVRVSTLLDAAADNVDRVTPREVDAVNVTNNDGEQEDDEGGEESQNDDDDVADDESDYSYIYEDEDEGHYSGFLIPTEPFESGTNNDSVPSHSAAAAAARGDNDDANVVASDSNAAAAAAAGGGATPRTISRAASRVSDAGGRTSPVPETNPHEVDTRKQKWKEPTRAAVNMSLRAEKEKTGGKRRLASDLYKIMMADTVEAGFSLEPTDEDSMEKWCIKLFGFDEDSNLAKDLMVCGNDHVQLEMSFPDQYPFEPPFVRVVKPRFKRQTGFVMSGALCMELLTTDGWNPINDIESVIVSIRSLMVVGDGRLQAAVDMGKDAYKKVLEEVQKKRKAEKNEAKMQEEAGVEEDDGDCKMGEAKRKRAPSDADADSKSKGSGAAKKATGGSYSVAEAQSAYDHLSKYHKKEGWDKSGWWSRKG
ncbi:hypothetical protein ACHAXR_006821 [Thalassiosira sp. AJA248-18]